MQSIRELIEKFDKKFSLDYYHLHFEIIEANFEKQPDICIESCKSLIEGIAKTIINFIGIPSDNKDYGKNIEDFNLAQLFRLALNCLKKSRSMFSKSNNSESNENTEIAFISNISNTVNVLGNIRNERGDISHGKSTPKTLQSDSIFSKAVYLMTESMRHLI